MIRFLLKGLLRDKSRSLFPILIVSIGVFLTVIMHAWMHGAMGEIVRSNANFSTGHVKIMSKAYAKSYSQAPNDLALLGVNDLMKDLKKRYANMNWVARIHFGGLLDVPDENGETKAQGPVAGLAVNLLASDSSEIATLNLKQSLVRGRLPSRHGEILVSEEFTQKLQVNPGDTVTLISSTMYGSMTMENFIIAGTVRFGINAMDRGAMLVDIQDIRRTLDMKNGAGEILGYFNDGIYDDAAARETVQEFNRRHENSSDKYAPTMLALRHQQGLGEYIDIGNYFAFITSAVFVLVMSIVLWNVGLIGGLRRYGEMGLRLAIGEKKGHVYASLIIESVIIGGVGSVIGTVAGIALAWYLQVHGLDIGSMAKNSSMMMSNIMRAEITATTFFIGFVPGLLSTILGAALSGIGIYRRQTAQLFKELDT